MAHQGPRRDDPFGEDQNGEQLDVEEGGRVRTPEIPLQNLELNPPNQWGEHGEDHHPRQEPRGERPEQRQGGARPRPRPWNLQEAPLEEARQYRPYAPVPMVMPSVPVINTVEIPNYEGTTNVKEFLSIFNDVADANNWSVEVKLRIMRTKLRGDARKYMQCCRAMDQDCTWKSFTKALVDRFEKPISRGEALQKYRRLKQRKDESAFEFSQRLQLAAFSTIKKTDDHGYTNAKREFLLEDALEQYMDGLLPALREAVVRTNPRNLDEATKAAETEETIQRRFASHKEVRIISEPDAIIPAAPEQHNPPNNQPLHQNMANNPYQQGGQRILRCYRCNLIGHFSKDCPACRYCKKFGHDIETCLTLIRKNQIKNEHQFLNYQRAFNNGMTAPSARTLNIRPKQQWNHPALMQEWMTNGNQAYPPTAPQRDNFRPMWQPSRQNFSMRGNYRQGMQSTRPHVQWKDADQSSWQQPRSPYHMRTNHQNEWQTSGARQVAMHPQPRYFQQEQQEAPCRHVSQEQHHCIHHSNQPCNIGEDIVANHDQNYLFRDSLDQPRAQNSQLNFQQPQ